VSNWKIEEDSIGADPDNRKVRAAHGERPQISAVYRFPAKI